MPSLVLCLNNFKDKTQRGKGFGIDSCKHGHFWLLLKCRRSRIYFFSSQTESKCRSQCLRQSALEPTAALLLFFDFFGVTKLLSPFKSVLGKPFKRSFSFPLHLSPHCKGSALNKFALNVPSTPGTHRSVLQITCRCFLLSVWILIHPNSDGI